MNTEETHSNKHTAKETKNKVNWYKDITYKC